MPAQKRSDRIIRPEDLEDPDYVKTFRYLFRREWVKRNFSGEEMASFLGISRNVYNVYSVGFGRKGYELSKHAILHIVLELLPKLGLSQDDLEIKEVIEFEVKSFAVRVRARAEAKISGLLTELGMKE